MHANNYASLDIKARYKFILQCGPADIAYAAFCYIIGGGGILNPLVTTKLD